MAPISVVVAYNSEKDEMKETMCYLQLSPRLCMFCECEEGNWMCFLDDVPIAFAQQKS